jgi:hypothetical protein
MKWLWTWGGTSFGYRQGDCLFTRGGREVGRFHGYEVYGMNGKYLGEVRNQARLITHIMKKSRRKAGFSPRSGSSYVDKVGYVG